MKKRKFTGMSEIQQELFEQTIKEFKQMMRYKETTHLAVRNGLYTLLASPLFAAGYYLGINRTVIPNLLMPVLFSLQPSSSLEWTYPLPLLNDKKIDENVKAIVENVFSRLQKVTKSLYNSCNTKNFKKSLTRQVKELTIQCEYINLMKTFINENGVYQLCANTAETLNKKQGANYDNVDINSVTKLFSKLISSDEKLNAFYAECFIDYAKQSFCGSWTITGSIPSTTVISAIQNDLSDLLIFKSTLKNKTNTVPDTKDSIHEVRSVYTGEAIVKYSNTIQRSVLKFFDATIGLSDRKNEPSSSESCILQ